MSDSPGRSIGRVGVSAGTAAVLGLTRARPQEMPTTGYFLFGEKCSNNCAFCSQASGATTGSHHLSRVTWPEYSWERIEAPLRETLRSGKLPRVCAQTVECADASEQALKFVRRVRGMSPSTLVSVSVAPVSVSCVKGYLDAGATNVGLPVDAATARIFSGVKGKAEGVFDAAWEAIRECASMWPGRISTHLIVGLGETEEEAVSFLARACDAGVTTGLFAFTPVKGTAMQDVPPPDVSSYRRVQLAAYYLRRGGDGAGIEFSGGRISRISFGSLLKEVMEGRPFETSGCPHCNRPFYNERPGQVMMNYPRRLSPGEASQALCESGITGEVEK